MKGNAREDAAPLCDVLFLSKHPVEQVSGGNPHMRMSLPASPNDLMFHEFDLKAREEVVWAEECECLAAKTRKSDLRC